MNPFYYYIRGFLIICSIALPCSLDAQDDESNPVSDASRSRLGSGESSSQALKRLLDLEAKVAPGREVPKIDIPDIKESDRRLYVSVLNLLPDREKALAHLVTVVEARNKAGKPHGAAIEYLWGNLLYNMGEYADALSHYEIALQSLPTYYKATLEAGMCCFYLGRKEEALKYLETGLASGGIIQTAQVLGMLGDLYRDLGVLDLALTSYQEALKQDPSDLHARINLAATYHQAGATEDALKHALEAVAYGGGSEDLYTIIADIHGSRHHYASALLAIENALLFNPGSRDLRRLQITLLDQAGRLEEAISVCEGMLLEDGFDLESWRFLSTAYVQQSRFDEAINAYEILRLCGDKSAQTTMNLSSLYADRGLADQGASVLSHGLHEIKPEEEVTRVLSLVNYYISEASGDAMTSLLNALDNWAKDRDDVRRTIALIQARRLISDEQTDDARALLKVHLKAHPDDAQAVLLYGEIEAKEGNLITARVHFERALIDEKMRADALQQIGLLDLRENKIDDSLEHLVASYDLSQSPRLLRFILKLCRHHQRDVSQYITDAQTL
jgi:tetratricopeptide (TPR) repeat protein